MKNDPIGEFQALFEKAKKKETHDATAASLATADASGQPSARMVLLKAADENGFVFYTNLGSRKVADLEANPKAALCIHWPELGKQVRIEGRVESVADDEADAYFASRLRSSQIGAWASRQSEQLDSRALLLASVAKYEARFVGRKIPRPEFWGGFRIVPHRIEIWHNQLHRLHDRVVYERSDDSGDWTKRRLFP